MVNQNDPSVYIRNRYSMPERYETELLVIDDTFINYCFRRNEADITRWEAYLSANPQEAATIAEARELVLGISLMLLEEAPVTTPEPVPLYKKNNTLKIWAVAASLLVVVATSMFFLLRNNNKPASMMAGQTYLFSTALAEKKSIRLPDSSVVILNAGSELEVDKNFGAHNRSVSLKGEALFEVAQNAELPFIVAVEGYDVKVLGTVFNVKAYPGEKKSETSLISGKVEIYLKNTTTAYKTLLPEEKFVISNDLDPLPASNHEKPRQPSTRIVPLSYTRDQINIETAWSTNRLVFENEKFSDMREKLERWFNVKITFENKSIEQYTFTATFEKENIEQVMKALQASYGFKYTIQGKAIKISN